MLIVFFIVVVIFVSALSLCRSAKIADEKSEKLEENERQNRVEN